MKMISRLALVLLCLLPLGSFGCGSKEAQSKETGDGKSYVKEKMNDPSLSPEIKEKMKQSGAK